METNEPSSNQVNELIKELEQKLSAMNLGVEAWVYHDPLTRSYSLAKATDQNAKLLPPEFGMVGFDKPCKEYNDVVLGWEDTGEKYALTVRTVTYEWHGEWIRKDEERRTSTLLLRASAQMRLDALTRFDALVSVLTERANQVIVSIKIARQTTDRL
jgi:hypothetical protein